MKMLFFALSLVVIPTQGSALTTAEYYALAPELVNTINNSWALIYTVSTGSFVAFYLFGWSANWVVRILGFVVFLVFLDEAIFGLVKGINTTFEAQLLLIASTNICSPEEAIRYVYEYAPLSVFCSTEQTEWGQLAVSDEQYSQGMEVLAESYADLGLIGVGHSMASPASFTIGNHILFLFARPANGLVCILSVLIWIIVPSKQFFRKKGWLDEA
jgi:hypothetical protein